ncbi:MAG: M12 family metallo-peptidase [Nitrospirota bacterium]
MLGFSNRKKIWILGLLFVLGCSDLEKNVSGALPTLPEPVDFDFETDNRSSPEEDEEVPIEPQVEDLFSPKELDLSPDQQAFLSKIETHPYDTIFFITKIDADFLSADLLNVAISADQVISFQKKRLDEDESGKLTWYGEDSNNQNQSALFVVNGDDIRGVITTETAAYRLHPLGGGLHVLSRLDPARLPPHIDPQDSPTNQPVEEETPSRAPLGKMSPDKTEHFVPNNAAANSDVTIDIMVVYTNAVAAATPDIDGMIQLAISETNQTYLNSGVHQRLNLVHKYKVTYTESKAESGFHTDLSRLQNEKDSFMDEIHQLRSQHKADIVTLLIDNKSLCGLGYLYADVSYAFTAVHYNCATGGTYAFAHEIGHLQGARHNPEDDRNRKPLAYAHGYRYQNRDSSKSWRTVMAYDCRLSCMVIPFWSNPRMKRDGVSMGTVSTHDNVRVLNKTGQAMADFMGTSQGNLSVAKAGSGSGEVISDPAGIDCGTDCTESFVQGKKVTLLATPSPSHFFSHWVGPCPEPGSPTCEVSINSDQLVTANFDKTKPAQTFKLDVTITGKSGKVKGTKGINCPSDCTGTLSTGTTVQLTASADPGSVFTGWDGGDCAGTGVCIIKMFADKTVMAGFEEMKKIGTATLIETDDSGKANSPRVGVDSQGNAIAIWQQLDGQESYILASQYVKGAVWESTTIISEQNTGNASFPKVAVNANGNIMAIWQQADKKRNDIWARSFVPGTGWETSVLIETNDTGTALFPQVALDSEGNAIAIWQQANKKRMDIWANRFVAGTGWETPVLIETNNTGSASLPQVGVDSNGNAMAIWQQSNKKRMDIWANRFISGIGWETPTLIETRDIGSALVPQIAVDPKGNAMAVWQQSDSKKKSIWANRYTVNVGWESPVVIEIDDIERASAPQITVDSEGNAVVVWRQSNRGVAHIWANSYVTNTGWQVPIRIDTKNAGNANLPQVSMNLTGNAVAVWQQTIKGQSHIWANRFLPNTGWQGAARINTDDKGNAKEPKVSIDASGSAIAVWQQSDKKLSNIWANPF